MAAASHPLDHVQARNDKVDAFVAGDRLPDRLERAQIGSASSGATRPVRDNRLLGPLHWLSLALIVAFGAAYQLLNPAVADVSWLIDVNQKMIAGSRLYVDVVETNPPMAVFLYTPAVMVSVFTGAPADIMQVFLTIGLVAGSLLLVVRIMVVAGQASLVPNRLLAGTVVLIAAPAYVFSEREHIALVLLLPMLDILVARAGRFEISRCIRFIAGLGAGIAISVKPHFALGLILPEIYLCTGLRSWRPLWAMENRVAGAIAIMHLAIIPLLFPAYFADIVPMLLDTYRLLKFSPVELLFDADVLLVIASAVATLLILGRCTLTPRILVPMLAALGFFAGFIEQGKGWIYQLYPTLALVAIIFLADAIPAIATLGQRPNRRKAHFAAAAVIGCLVTLQLARVELVLKDRHLAGVGLAQPIAHAFSHPRILALSSDLSVGHPLTSMVGGTWVGTFGQQIVLQAATTLSEVKGVTAARRAELAHWIERDRTILAHDIAVGQPDLILLDRAHFPFDDLMASGTDAARLLGGYKRIATINDIDLLVPNARAAAATVAMNARGL